MSFIAWNDRLLVGVSVIDQDHKRLVRMLNELYDAIARGDGQAVVGDLLNRLELYTQDHFQREEALFTQSTYPHTAAHRRQHEWMRAKVAALQTSFREGTLGAPSLQLITILKDWLFDHILGIDQQIVPYLRAASLA
ncbi:MAG TPA: bacteriohemerythrin [Acidobacteriaceae bacterium]|jgi:hemerythrin-like metal-binding protein|nr:bacteriohemerythrin [Acidobacteriaceae bacterium]